jgi:ParB family chromosome partitioning protein
MAHSFTITNKCSHIAHQGGIPMNGTAGLLNTDDIKSASSGAADCAISYCPVEMSSITEERCKELTSDPRYNGICIRHKECISKWKACPSCLRFGEVKKMGHVGPVCCAREKNLCGFHLFYGAGAHRSVSEMRDELKKYEDGLVALQNMGSAPQKTFKGVPVKKHDHKLTDGPNRMDLIKQSAEKAHACEKEAGESFATDMPISIGLKIGTEIVASEEIADIAALSVDAAEEIQLPASTVTVEEEDKTDAASDETVIIIEEKISEDVPGVGEVILLNDVDENGVITQTKATVLSEVFYAPWDEIFPYKRQPRKHFNEARMLKLACSIREKGQIIPILLRRLENGSRHKWELIDGERRYRACKIADKKFVKAILVDVEDEWEQFETSVIANFCREGHTPMEIAYTIQRFKEERGYTDAQIGKLFGESEEGKSGSWVFMHYSLLKLHPQVQDMLDPDLPKRQRLAKSIAFELVMQEKDHDRQLAMAKEIIERKMSTSHAKSFIRSKAKELTGTYKVREGTRRQRPSDHYKLFVDFVGRTRIGFANHTGGMGDDFQDMLSRRSQADRDALSDSLKQVIELAEKMRETIENID